MKKAKERFYEHCRQQFQQASNKLLALTLDKIDYPDFDPIRADQITRTMIAQGRLAVIPEGIDCYGVCV